MELMVQNLVYVKSKQQFVEYSETTSSGALVHDCQAHGASQKKVRNICQQRFSSFTEAYAGVDEYYLTTPFSRNFLRCKAFIYAHWRIPLAPLSHRPFGGCPSPHFQLRWSMPRTKHWLSFRATFNMQINRRLQLVHQNHRCK